MCSVYSFSRVQPAEDARANAGDKEDPELLQVGVAVEGPGQHLLRGDKHAQRLGEQGDGGQEFDFHEDSRRASGILGDGEGGAKVRNVGILAREDLTGPLRKQCHFSYVHF